MSIKRIATISVLMLLMITELFLLWKRMLGPVFCLLNVAGCAIFVVLNILDEIKQNDRLFNKMMADADEAFRQNQPQAAKRIFEQLVKVRPDSFEVQIGMGQCHRLMREVRDAIRVFKRAVSLAPKKYEGHYFLGITYLHSGKIREAIDTLETARKLNPGNADIYYFLGKVHEKIQSSQDAMAHYQRHLELKPDSKYREEVAERIERIRLSMEKKETNDRE